MRVVVTVLTTLFIASVGWAAWQGFQFLMVGAGTENETGIVEVQRGATFDQVNRELAERGFIERPFLFKILARGLGYAEKVRMGEYLLNKGMTPVEILQTLSSGKSVQRALTIQEGLNMYEIAELFEAQGFGKSSQFLKKAQDPQLARELLGKPLRSLEGYLFPETYHLTKYVTAEQLIRTMVGKFLEVYQQVAQRNDTDLSRHEVVTLASIIEKETGAPEERPQISSVFHNRLEKGMRLQSDPTIIYGILLETKEMPENIRRKDINDYTPYNTYRIDGLPPGPIANPGQEALLAAVQPETTKYLYFVSRNDGTHVFSTNLRDHNNAVNKWQRTKENREGRSWRDRLESKEGAKTK